MSGYDNSRRTQEEIVKITNVIQATKHDQGKARLSLIPNKALEEIGHVFTFGATKYSADNWRNGLQYRRLLDALLRHVSAFNRGEDLDPESGRSHLAHAGCCVMMLLEQVLENKTDFDDRYKP